MRTLMAISTSTRLLVAVSFGALASAAMAQSAAPTAPPPGPVAADAGSGQLQEIVVTAQRRAQNLQDVPIAVSTITALQTQHQGIIDTQSLGQLVPGLNFDRTPTASTPFMRGVGTAGSTIGNEPSIAFYIDDVYVPNGNAAAFEFNNLEALEVLRGPQGTLFGRNAVGGLINVRTRDPSHTTSLDANAGYGNYDTFKGQVYATTGLTDTLAFNIAAQYNDQTKGWGHDIVTGHDAFKAHGYGIRAKLLFEPTSNLRILLSGDHERSTSDIGTPGRVLSGTVAGTAGQCLKAPVVGCQGAFYNPDAAGAGFYDTTGNVDSYGKRYFDQVTLKVRYETEHAVIQSISAYSYTKFLQVAQDNDATPYALFTAHYPQYQHAFTQELQISALPHAPVQWILGAFYYHDNSVFDALYAFNGLELGGAPAGIYGASKTNSVAAYAQSTFEILPQTNLTVGVRYTKDYRDYTTQNSLSAFFANPSAVFFAKKSFDAVTGRVAIDHHLNKDVMIYAAYNRGFKSGVFPISGFNPGSATPPPPVNPEELNAYSAGFKSELFDRHLRLNVEGFYYDYSNIQLFNVIPGGTQLRNAAGAHIKGVDVDVAILPVEHLTINVGAEVLNGHYTSFPNGAAYLTLPPNPAVPVPQGGCAGIPPYPAAGAEPIFQANCDLSGQKTIETPPFSVNVSAEYVIPTEAGNFTLAADFAHRASYYFEADNTYTSRQPRTNIVNSSLSWSSPSKTFDVRGWVNNLTDQKSYSYLAPSASVGARYSPRAPRTYGITAGVHF